MTTMSELAEQKVVNMTRKTKTNKEANKTTTPSWREQKGQKPPKRNYFWSGKKEEVLHSVTER